MLLQFLPISLFIQLFCPQNVEKAYVDQRLKCATPKSRSKYTTNIQRTFPFNVPHLTCNVVQRQCPQRKIQMKDTKSENF